MMKTGRNLLAALVLGILIAGVSGCQKKEGPMERAGKEIDRGAEKAGQKIDRSVEKSGEKLENAGDKIKESVK
jgi:hypothetical protein